MMDLDESIRALYFAPVALIVLDQNRHVRMMNAPAKKVSGECERAIGRSLREGVEGKGRSKAGQR